MNILKTTLLILSIFLFPQIGSAYYTLGAQTGSSGYNGDTYGSSACAFSGCHTGSTLNGGGGALSISVLDSSNNAVTSYTAGATYTVTVAITHSGASRYGFQARTVDTTTGASSGTLAVSNSTTTQLDTNTSYIEFKNDATGSATSSWSFNWVAPSTASNSITFHAAGVAGNGNATSTDDSAYSSSKTLTAGSTTTLTAPTGYSATVSGSSVATSWTAASGASGYKVYYGTTSGTYINASTGVNLGNRTSFTFNNIPAGTYYLALKSYDSSGNLSSYSSEISVTVTSTTLAAPTNYSATVSGSSVATSWTAASGASGYKVYYGTTSGTYINASTGADLGNRTSFTFNNIPAGTYYIALKSYNSSGTLSSYSSEVTVV
ncbi:MAG: hypothetical protein HQK84_02140, partial [Nitrospinae bacterium]|nr:hypothetical protein [Nitrospinota bacterium]